MKRRLGQKVLSILAEATLAIMMLAGCGNSVETAKEIPSEELIEETPVAKAPSAETNEQETQWLYFTKGVYTNYAQEAENPTKDYFYVFSGDDYGYTDDARSGVGLPFACRQEDGAVYFCFGGDGETEEKLMVTEIKNGMIYGYFEGVEDRPLIFEPVPDADPVGFNAQNYMSDGDYVYNDANGWSIKYDPERFDITQEGNKVAIVYNGEGVGTNMVLVTYDIEHNGEEMRDEIAKGYGDNATKYEATFPGTEDVEGFWAICPPAADGSGLYMTSISRDYMDGSLTFELTGHNTGDDAVDMEVSDYMAMIIDSLTFTNYEN